MFIKSLYYKDEDINWELEKIELKPLTLFVGISGVGKSRILEAISNLKGIMQGDTDGLGGVKWDIEFLVDEMQCRWKGSFAPLHMPILKTQHKNQVLYYEGVPCIRQLSPAFVQEELTCDGENIFSRTQEGQTFKGAVLPKTNRYKSFMEVFSEDEDIEKICSGFLNIFHLKVAVDRNLLVENAMLEMYCERSPAVSPSEVMRSELPIITKLAYMYRTEDPLFEKIKQKFLDIFPYVEDVKFETDENIRYYTLYIKEQKTGWISQSYMSSGMFKTLIFLAQMNTLQGRCVVLLDEIENSLGLNCIDILAEELRGTEYDDQFLITSHHPYIINNIAMDDWRIVKRSGGVVTVKTAKDLQLGRSSHEAYFQLINSPEYAAGIE